MCVGCPPGVPSHALTSVGFSPQDVSPPGSIQVQQRQYQCGVTLAPGSQGLGEASAIRITTDVGRTICGQAPHTSSCIRTPGHLHLAHPNPLETPYRRRPELTASRQVASFHMTRLGRGRPVNSYPPSFVPSITMGAPDLFPIWGSHCDGEYGPYHDQTPTPSTRRSDNLATCPLRIRLRVLLWRLCAGGNC